jgi:hypothetical protein
MLSLLECLIGGVVAGLLISLLYIYTHKKEGYSQSYVFTLLVLPPVIAAMIAMLNSNLANATATGIGLAGVFTLCRYRTVPGDPKDITYVFFAMAEGAIIGMSGDKWESYAFAGLFFVAIAVLLTIVSKTSFGVAKTSHMTLKITIPENLDYIGLFDEVLDRNTSSWRLKRVKTTDFGSLFELIYSVEVRNNIDQKKFIDDLRKLNGNLTVILAFFQYDEAVYEKK